MPRRVLLVLAAAALVLLAAASAARVPVAHATTYLFHDEFNGAAGPPSSSKWSVTTGTCSGDGWNCYDAGDVYQDGLGHLVLSTSCSTGCDTGPWSSARLQGFVEGSWPPSTIKWSVSPPVHIEASVKMPAAVGGVWDGFWPMTVDQSSPTEYDVQEWRGAYPRDISCHVHGPFDWGMTATLPLGVSNYVTYWMNLYTDHVYFGATVNGVDLPCGDVALDGNHPVSARLDNHVGDPASWGGAGGPPPAGTYLEYVDWVRAWSLS